MIRKLTILVVVIALLGLAGFGVWTLRPEPEQPAGRRPLVTATIIRQTLTETTTVSGTLGNGPAKSVANRLAGTITWVPEVETTIDRGGVLYRVDDQPVVLFFGDIPAYRQLTPGEAAVPADPVAGTPARASVPASTGADVRQVEENLRALGYQGFAVDDRYDQKTAAAVRRWQRDLGLPQSGQVDLGRVVYLPGSARIDSVTATPGAPAEGPVLNWTSPTRLVTAALQAYQQGLARPDTPAKVLLEDGRELDGAVRSVGQPQSDSGRESPTVDAVIALADQGAIAELDNGLVRVMFHGESRPDVLTVPVGALLALAEGGYGLELLDGDQARIVAVQTGLFAAGRVEVSGPDLAEGLTVGMAP